ncbi:TonB-dependent receptor [Ascidiimonas aurantiaca]|uniref:TonB-dependent receptor n=1 Tax=Ascidiimonas aurantiaca TaxID=1685432 RepID=UPI0030ED9BF1
MKAIYNWFLTVVVALVATTAFSQGVTTSSLGGKVTDNQGEPLPGANVVAIHTPTGTTYGAVTDFDGFYRISNMRVGGPYRITISYIGFNDFVKEDLFLALGERARISAQMQESATALDEVVITAQGTGLFRPNKTGAETSVSQRDIQTLPQTSRSIVDFVRITPQAQIREDNDGFSISLAGQNNRYNAIYIDGAVNNDVFGLAGSGTNGGQTGVNPFSVDAIETFQVQLAPFDVRIGGFSGGAINAITRSGTNEWKGSAYAFFRNEKLAGKTPESLTSGERERLAEFTANTYGARIGGPIIKDKLFFFFNYEREDREVPQPYDFDARYQGSSSLAEIQALRAFVDSRYGYDIGVFDAAQTLVSDKITTRFDYNINERNKLILTYRYVKADNLEARNSNNNRIGFSSGSETFVNTTHSGSLEWNYQGDNIANSFILGYTRVRDDRDPSGDPFPSVVISDGNNPFSNQGLRFGSERFSTANLLDQDVFTITNNFEIYKGAHTITLGTHNEFSSIKNLFFPSNFGFYIFDTIDDFVNGGAADVYEKGYSLVGGNAIGDASAGAAEFDMFQLGLYVQDEIQFNDRLKVTAGIRFDVPFFENGTANEDFNTRGVALLEAAGKDLQGARVGRGINSIVHVSPRVGFNWDVTGDRSTQIRGGLGIFTSRIPLVWPAATFNNNGVTGGFTDEGDLGGNVTFNPDVNQQPVHVQPGSGGLGGDINIFTPDFKLPQRFRTNLAVDQKLPLWGLVASADFIWNDNITDVYYQNLNIGGPVGNLVGADNRPFYSRDRIVDTYNRVILASNTSAGDSWNVAFTLTKPFENGFQGSVSYSYGEANAIFDGTSSQNSSQWRNIQTVNGKNSDLPVTRSDFNQGHRITSNISYEFKWTETIKSTIGLFYEGSQNAPYSFIYREGRDLLGDDSRDNALIYIPRDQSEINLVDIVEDGNVVFTADQQWQALNEFIEGNDYLNGRRGEYAERNGVQGPWNHIIDLRFAQDFGIKVGNKTHTLQLTADIFNFTNFINKDWGKRRFVPGNEVSLIETRSGGPNPTFSFDPRRFDRLEDGFIDLDDRDIASSRWQMQFGVRYIFD